MTRRPRKADITIETHHGRDIGAGRSREDARKAQEAVRNLARKAAGDAPYPFGQPFGVVAAWCYTCDTLDVCRTEDALVRSLGQHGSHVGGVGGGPEVRTAGDLAAVLPEKFRSIYWNRKVAEFCEREGLPT